MDPITAIFGATAGAVLAGKLVIFGCALVMAFVPANSAAWKVASAIEQLLSGNVTVPVGSASGPVIGTSSSGLSRAGASKSSTVVLRPPAPAPESTGPVVIQGPPDPSDSSQGGP